MRPRWPPPPAPANWRGVQKRYSAGLAAISVQIAGRYPLADASRAQQDLASRSLAGKLLSTSLPCPRPDPQPCPSPHAHRRALEHRNEFSDMATGPLTDIVVLDLSRALAGLDRGDDAGRPGCTGDQDRITGNRRRLPRVGPAIRRDTRRYALLLLHVGQIKTKNPSNWT